MTEEQKRQQWYAVHLLSGQENKVHDNLLKRIKTELRLPNVLDDTTWCKGKVTNKYVEDGHALVELEIWAESQRGQASAPNGKAVVILPSRAISSRICRNGSSIDLGHACYPLKK